MVLSFSDRWAFQVAALAVVMFFRMLGVFLILPVATAAVGADGAAGGGGVDAAADALLAGAAGWQLGLLISGYGITQAFLQIPLGVLSDRYGRKPVLGAALLLFAAGSFLAAAAETMTQLLIGRLAQGAAAIAAVSTAWIIDIAPVTARARAMAGFGVAIGLAFVVSLLLAPPLFAAVGIFNMFGVTGGLALLSLGLLFFLPPPPKNNSAVADGVADKIAADNAAAETVAVADDVAAGGDVRSGSVAVAGTAKTVAAGIATVDAETVAGDGGAGGSDGAGADVGAGDGAGGGAGAVTDWWGLWGNAGLRRCAVGAFVLHYALASLFFLLPPILNAAGHSVAAHSGLYALGFAVSLVISLPLLARIDRQPLLFAVAILLLLAGFLPLPFLAGAPVTAGAVAALVLFFGGFVVLEAALPARAARHHAQRGAAMGLVFTLEFLGLFAGGLLTGLANQQFGSKIAAVITCAVIAAWLLMNYRMLFFKRRTVYGE